jgi:chitin synthase
MVKLQKTPPSSRASSVISFPDSAHLPAVYPENPLDASQLERPGMISSHSHHSSALSGVTTLPGSPSTQSFQIDEKADPKLWDKHDGPADEARIAQLGSLSTMVDEKPDVVDLDGHLERRGKRLMKVRKLAFQCTIFGLK